MLNWIPKDDSHCAWQVTPSTIMSVTSRTPVHRWGGMWTCLACFGPSRDDLKREAKRLRKELRSKDKEKEAKVEDSKEGMCFTDILHSLGGKYGRLCGTWVGCMLRACRITVVNTWVSPGTPPLWVLVWPASASTHCGHFILHKQFPTMPKQVQLTAVSCSLHQLSLALPLSFQFESIAGSRLPERRVLLALGHWYLWSLAFLVDDHVMCNKTCILDMAVLGVWSHSRMVKWELDWVTSRTGVILLLHYEITIDNT